MKVKYVTIQHFVKDDVTPPVTIDIERVFFVEIPYKLNEEETKKFVDIVQQHNPFYLLPQSTERNDHDRA